MKILLLGANGQVGTECRRSLTGLGDLVCATRDGRLSSGEVCEQADFEGPDSLYALVRRIAPDVVVNAAAYTAVDRAEQESDAAFLVNAKGPETIARACAELGAYLIHYSTDYVFDEQGNRPYLPDDPTAPLGVYGESKLAGEEAVRASGCDYAILRTAWVYAAHGKNFLLTMLRLANERDELRVVGDQVGTPTPAALIADATARIVTSRNRPSGTWHLTPHGQTSWHGFAEAIIEGAHRRGLLAKRPIVTAISTAEFPTPAARPAWSVLDNASLERDWHLTLPAWQTGLDEVLDELAAAP
ncbi:dTDP-4-dehydrorhamnose reductase [Solilutibacter tolerans]|uniref:dTDP-4-dehydrorhamnose reductase n=1 Tax=Solilutibacter tolerans TaxID=1604334 RepID=A0A1N6N8J9_9GAMM|nr:dTDP-4-dehydrorhamnose reductase [Lysobacter tolerans]SIP88372.1 dTDP-4-dehydrorhamnose reductase [Lysobacter tolerans]